MVSIDSYRKGQMRYSLPAPDRQRREYKQVAMKGVVQLGPNPFQQIFGF
jgi:hypothetical protein